MGLFGSLFRVLVSRGKRPLVSAGAIERKEVSEI